MGVDGQAMSQMFPNGTPPYLFKPLDRLVLVPRFHGDGAKVVLTRGMVLRGGLGWAWAVK